jgi:hypothetical protein
MLSSKRTSGAGGERRIWGCGWWCLMCSLGSLQVLLGDPQLSSSSTQLPTKGRDLVFSLFHLENLSLLVVSKLGLESLHQEPPLLLGLPGCLLCSLLIMLQAGDSVVEVLVCLSESTEMVHQATISLSKKSAAFLVGSKLLFCGGWVCSPTTDLFHITRYGQSMI